MFMKAWILLLGIGLASCSQETTKKPGDFNGKKRGSLQDDDRGEEGDISTQGQNSSTDVNPDDEGSVIQGTDELEVDSELDGEEETVPNLGNTPSTGTSTQPSGSPAPQNPAPVSVPDSNQQREVHDPTVEGPYDVAQYTQGLDSQAYRSAEVFYPSDLSKGPFPVTTVSGGFSNTKENVEWISRRVASHGVIAIAFTPTNNLTTNATIWSTGHKGALTKIAEENARQGSPISGAVDLNNQGIMGFSMGGAGTIIGANELPNVKSAIPLCAFQPVTPTMNAATLFITGTNDTIASPNGVRNAYQSFQGTNRAFANFQGLTHNGIVGPGRFEEGLSQYIVSWLKVFLDQEDGYKLYINGAENQADIQAGMFGNGNFEAVLAN